MNAKIKGGFGLLVIAFIVIGLIFSVVMFMDQINIKTTINDYLDALKQSKYEEAFERIAYYDEYSDIPPKMDYESAKEIWTLRVERLKNEGIWLKDYHSIRVWKDDTYPMSEATIIVTEGKKDRIYNVSIHLAKFNGQWKIQSIFSMEQNQFEKTVSGYVGSSNK